MRKNTLNFLVDAATLVVILAMVATGLVVRFVLPPGTGGRQGGRELVLWGLGRHDWGDIHFWASVALGVLLIVHVALHWSWVCTTLHRLLGGKDAGRPSAARHNAYGIGFLVALFVVFGGFTWYADTVVRESPSTENVEDDPQSSGSVESEISRAGEEGAVHGLIQGSMSLAEVEQATGVPVAILRSELGLPEQTPGTARLGRLGRQHGFDVQKVRDLVAKHQSRIDKR